MALAVKGSNIYAGTRGDGVFVSTDNGVSWIQSLKGEYVLSLAVCGSNLFAGISGGFYCSTDNGASWANSGLLNKGVNSLSAFGTILFAGTYNGLFLSTDNGSNWTTSLPDLYVNAFMVNGMNLYTGIWGGGVWKFPLTGLVKSVWQADINIKDNGTNFQLLSFGQSPAATDGIDAALGEVPLPPAPIGFDARLHLPTGEDSWNDYRASEKDSIKWLIKFQPGNGGYPFTFTWDNAKLPNGSFYLKDNVTGTIVNVDMKKDSSYTLTNPGISELKIELKPEVVDVKDARKLPTVFSLSQNYPNPFNPSTMIKYGLPEAGNVRISIYNLIGQEVESLVNETQNAGYHEVMWNASNKASGVYLYTINVTNANGKGNFRSAKKLILLK